MLNFEFYLDLMNDSNYNHLKNNLNDILDEIKNIPTDKLFYLCCAYGYFNYPELFELMLNEINSRKEKTDYFEIILNIISGQIEYWGIGNNKYAIYAIGNKSVIMAYNYRSAFDVNANQCMHIMLKYISIDIKELFYTVINKNPPIQIEFKYPKKYKYNDLFERIIRITI